MRLRLLFWNLGGERDLSSEVALLAHAHRVDAVGLCETLDNEWDSYERELGVISRPMAPAGERLPRIRLFVRSDWTTEEAWGRSSLYRIYRVEPQTALPFVLGLAHFRSKIHDKNDERLRTAQAMADTLRKVAASELGQGAELSRVIAMGDFNADPWESPLLNGDALRALEDWDFLDRPLIRAPGDLDTEDFPSFYNPMWRRVGRGSHPMGTYYYDSPGMREHHWHAYDTALVRSAHIQRHGPPAVRVLTHLPDGVRLVTDKGRPLGKAAMSDHLPVLARIPI